MKNNFKFQWYSELLVLASPHKRQRASAWNQHQLKQPIRDGVLGRIPAEIHGATSNNGLTMS